MQRFGLMIIGGTLMASLSSWCGNGITTIANDNKGKTEVNQETSWTLSVQDGAIGDVRTARQPAHGGTSSFLVSYKNSLGYAKLSSGFIPVQPGKTYRVSAWIYPVRTVRRGVYLEVSQYRAGSDTPLSQDNWGSTPQSFAGGQWQKISIPVTASHPRLRIHGIQSLLTSEVYWDDFTVAEVMPGKYEPPENEPLPDLARAKAIMAKRARAEVRVEQRDGRPRLFLDGVPTPWAFYVNPCQQPRNAQIADFRDAGIRVYLVPLILGSGFLPGRGAWRGHDNWDFSEIDDLLWRVLRVDPNGYIVFYMGCGPYREWGAENPGHVTQDQEGNKIIVNDSRPQRWGGVPKPPECFGPSLVSLKFRTDVSATLRKLASYVERSEAGKAVIGYHITGGSDGQWIQWTQNFPGKQISPYCGDYCPGAQDSFREWLRRRYGGNSDALRKAWNQPDLTFATAAVPGKERYLGLTDNFLSPETHQDVIDYNRFHSEGVVETVLTLANALKSATPRRILCGMYYEDITSPVASHTALGRLLADGGLDYLSGPAAYDIRVPGYQSAVRSVFGSTLLHGKTYLTEEDWRSLHSGPNGPAENFSWGRAETAEDHNAMVRRECGMMLAFGLGTWWYDMTGGWFHDVKIMAGIAEARRAFGRDLQNHGAPAADLAVFVSEDSSDCVAPGVFAPFRQAIIEQIHELNTAGVPYRLYLQSDLGRLPIPKHRLYLFLNPYKISAAEKTAIEKLKRDGNLLVFLHAPGTVGATDPESAIADLTGMRVRRIPGDVPGLGLIPENAPYPLLQGLDGMLTLPCAIHGPAYELIDGQAVPLARYAYKNGSVGAAIRNFGAWKSVFIGGTGVSAPFLANLAREAGCWRAAAPGDAVYASQHFLTIHAMFPGRKTLTLASPSRVVDLSTNQVMAEHATTFQVEMERGVTRWFALTPAETK